MRNRGGAARWGGRGRGGVSGGVRARRRRARARRGRRWRRQRGSVGAVLERAVCTRRHLQAGREPTLAGWRCAGGAWSRVGRRPPPRNRPPLRQVPSVLVIGALAGERRPAPPRARLTFSGGVFEPRRRAPRALLVPPHRGPPTLPRPRNTRSAAARSPRPAAHPPRAASAARRRALRPSRALAAVNGEPPRPRPPSEAVCTFVGTDPRWAGGAPPPPGPSRFARPPVLFPPLRPSPPTPQCPPTAARA